MVKLPLTQLLTKRCVFSKESGAGSNYYHAGFGPEDTDHIPKRIKNIHI